MNIKILLFALSAAAISSCSTAYKSGQTPDDVYYSKARVAEEEVQETKQKEEVKKVDYEEREIRMSAYDRRWRDFDDDYDYRYDPYNYGYSYGYYYNPYYCHYPVYFSNIAIRNPKNTTPRMTNLGSYNHNSFSVANTKYGSSTQTGSYRTYNNSNRNTSVIRRLFSSPGSNESNSTRSYTPSSSSSSGSSSGSSGSVSRPKRGG